MTIESCSYKDSYKDRYHKRSSDSATSERFPDVEALYGCVKEDVCLVRSSAENFSPLCHEHHVKMRGNQIPLKSEGGDTYACTEPVCLIHYNISRGYFVLSGNGNMSELDMLPKVTCPRDGVPMYLAEIDPEKRGFRLWKCPQCGKTRTNAESLVGAE